MVNVASLFVTLSIAFATARATGGKHGGGVESDACPKGYKLTHVKGWNWSSCECINDVYHNKPMTQGWSAKAIQDRKGAWSCNAKCDHPPPPPKPSASHTPGHGGGKPPGHGHGHGKPPGHGHGGKPPGHGHGGKPPGHGGNGKPPGHGGNGKPPGHGNGHGHWKKRSQSALEVCPPATLACPIFAAGFGAPQAGDFECVHAEEDLDNCGACGNSCIDVAGVKGTACVVGRCEVYSCLPGFTLVTSLDGSSSCHKS